MENATEAPKSSALYRNGHEIECWLTDMDGVLVHENHALPGAAELIQQWGTPAKPLPRAHQQLHLHAARPGARLRASGLDVPEESIWTSALATADFLKSQMPRRDRAFVIGEAGLTTALHEAGFIMTETRTRTTSSSARPATTRSRRSPRRSA